LFKVRRYVEAVDLLKKLRGFAESGARAAAVAAAKEVVIHTRKQQKGGGGSSTVHTLQRISHTSSSAIATAATTAVGEITMNNGGGGESGKMINSTSTNSASSYMSSVTAIQTAYNFLCCLMGADCDGRVVVNRVGIDFNSSSRGGGGTDVASSVSSSSQPFFKFVLLNPAVPFLRVVQNARSVVLVGGTMQPISDITDQLFGHLPSNRVITFSCGHVIPRENLAVFTLAKGPSGQAFDFRHASRSSTAMIAELGRAIVNLSSLIPSGLVVFMPSYDYLRTALAIWSKAPTQQQQQHQHSTSQVGGGGGGAIAQPLLTYQQQMDIQNFKSSSSSVAQTAQQQQQQQQQQSLPGASLPAAPVGSVLAMLQKKKKVFAEPKSSSDVEAILRAYTLAIRSPSSSSRPPSRSDTPIRDDGGFSLLDEESDVNHNYNDHDDDHNKGDDDNARLLMSSSTIPSGGSIGGGGGALLFCVVGGKMSEGINFSDDLARGVAVVGLPYPNPSDPELVERMAYLDRRGAANVNQQQQHSTPFLSSSGSITLNNTTANTSTLPLPSPAPPALPHPHPMTTGREYYENLTIRAVNQAIGRSIRHAKDYAVIVLLDGRYTQQRIKSKLPGWISERISSSSSTSSVGGMDPNGWGPCASGIGTFFRQKAGAATSVTGTVLKAV